MWYFLVILAILHLGLLKISPQYRYIVQASIPSFSFFFPLLLSSLSVIILVFSNPILFCFFLFLYSTFHVFYFLSFSSVFLCISSTFSFFFCLFFVCLLLYFMLTSMFLLWLSLFIIYFLFLLLSLSLSSTFLLGFLLLSFFACLLLYSPYSSLYLFAYMCFAYYYYYYPPVLLFCIFYLLIFCLPFLLIFLHFSFTFVSLILFFFLSL